jgi:hypothetical protein
MPIVAGLKRKLHTRSLFKRLKSDDEVCTGYGGRSRQKGPVTEDFKVWADAERRTSWSGRFLDCLKAHGTSPILAFMYFE